MPNIAPVYRVRVAVAVHLYRCFDYLLSEADYQRAQIGARVAISFGRQNLVGIIMEKVALDHPVDPQFQLKMITELLDEDALLDTAIFQLLQWSAKYYHAPIGEVMQTGLPSLLRQGRPYNLLARTWKLLNLQAEALISRSEKQQHAYKLLKLHPSSTAENTLNAAGVDTATLKALAKKSICQCELLAQDFQPMPMQLAQLPLTPNEDQKKAIASILKAQHKYQAFLLDGLTGSGKTEVYLQVMQEVIKQGKQVLVLVPEIGLTPQTASRFQARFHCHIALLHSGLNDSKRLQAWQAAQTGKASIVLGTRSAIYTPLPRLGLIILDEEHDLSFKQQEGFRYHARDVALYRAYMQQCPIVLGSATPSFDSYALVKQEKMSLLHLNQRAGLSTLPPIHLIDLKVSPKKNGISLSLIEQIRQRLQKKEQVLIFLNRRGYAPVLICESCAWQAQCPNCDANLTLHLQPYQHLQCHHCSSIQTLPKQCPACQKTELKPIGLATAKVEEHLHALFPETQIIRVDRDSTSRVGSWQSIYERIQSSQPMILLGTQMLAKGHHFPYVTLVAILDIDSGLMSVDFRAPERTAQLIIQVAGRAGRGEHKGEVYLQTLRPDHPMLTTLVQQDYRAFAKHSLKERKLAQLPPFRYAALLRCESRSQEENINILQQHAQLLREQAHIDVEIWGPIPAPMERKARRFQAHLMILAHERPHLHAYLTPWWQNLLHQKPSHMKLSLDIDPQEFG